MAAMYWRGSAERKRQIILFWLGVHGEGLVMTNVPDLLRHRTRFHDGGQKRDKYRNRYSRRPRDRSVHMR